MNEAATRARMDVFTGIALAMRQGLTVRALIARVSGLHASEVRSGFAAHLRSPRLRESLV
jgi:hypothetical protein